MVSGSSDAGTTSPASILLATEAHVAFSRNHTTARAKRLWGTSTVEVTFWIAEPPDVSFYTLHCNPPMAIPDADLEEVVAPVPISVPGDVCVRPRVVGAEGRFVLLSTLFRGHSSYEYFMYKGDPKSPSLESLPLPDDDYSLRGAEFAIVPRGEDDHYLLIALSRDLKMDNYRLHIYSSEDATWTTKELLNPCPRILIKPDKVFVIRDGLLLWVDLLRGILVCDVLQESHHAKYIPLPEPLPGNRAHVKQLEQGVRCFRDLTCVDGLIKFIEMEHREIEREVLEDLPPEKPVDPRTKDEVDPRIKDVFYDSDLISLTNHRPVKPKTSIEVSVDGWNAITWTRNIKSNCWRKGRIVDVDDILVADDSVFSEFLSSEKSECAESLTFKNLYSDWPTLSADVNDILYLKSTSTSGGGALVAVDLAEKRALKVETLKSHPFGKYFYVSPWQILRPCALANHLKMTAGTETSTNQIALMDSYASEPALMDSFANEQNNTAMHVGETDSYESKNKRPSLLAAEVNHAQNGAQSTVENVIDSYESKNERPRLSAAEVNHARNGAQSAVPNVADSYESKNKRPRLSAVEVNHARNGAQSNVVLNSPAHPNQNNMPPQLWFNRWEQPGCIGYSSWPHQNNPPPPQCFNRWSGPFFNPVYTPMPPAPTAGDYQLLWQQPLLLEQEAAPGTFGPVEAPYQFFNNWHGASCHGNSQQHPAGSSYSYGARSSYSGNYHPATHIPMLPTHHAAATTISSDSISPPMVKFGPHAVKHAIAF